ncbi:MAG: hypothetical protein ABIT76_00230 [Chthoniobacterales bacterium]
MPLPRFLHWLALAGLLFTGSCSPKKTTTNLTDSMTLGDAASEKAHGLDSSSSDIAKGLLGDPVRRLLPLAPPTWEGGKLSFKMKVDPARQNYFSIRFSGDEVTENRLVLYADGKQIGWRHLGEVEQLDYGSVEPGYLGRFYYNTCPLPLELTQGKTELTFEIRSNGRIWGYGSTWEQYQKPMTQPTRGIYRVYTHNDACLVPPANEKQGSAPAAAPVRQTPGEETLTAMKDRVNHEVDARLTAKNPLSQMQMGLLAKAYDVPWTHAFQNPAVIEQIVKSLDNLFAAYRKNPKLAQAEPSTWNPDWFGLGPSGQVIALRSEQLQPRLDEMLDDGNGTQISRRAAFTEMLLACRDWHRLNRRQYTNQTMLNDLNGIYFPNRGLAVLDPAKALPEPEVRRYLYESVALEPWRDSDPGGHMWNVGPNYRQLTAKGLTKELGYVGTYGEVIDLVSDIYNATRPAPGQPGDEKIKAQLVRIALARSYFRHPSLDAEGHRAMRLEQVVGWRDSHYPGVMAYGQRATRDASALQAAAITLDPKLVGYAQQMIADNQFFASEVEAMEDGAQPLRTTIGRLETPDEYELIKAQPPSAQRLPMSWDQPDFVFSDEDDGVLALKRGQEILYASLYWRARYGINHLARVHFLTPQIDRIAVVRQETQFTPSGLEFTWPNWTNMAFGNGGLKYPGNLQSAYAGMKVPIAKIPDGIPFQPGQESPYAGRGDFYTCRYGDYLIGMNCSADQTFELKSPAGLQKARDLVTAKDVDLTIPLKLPPKTTVVLWLGAK